MSADILIKNGILVDGLENERYRANILIDQGKIVKIGSSELEVDAKEIIDAKNQIVAPGFVDTHTHSDLMLLFNRQHSSALYQGITTEVTGQDGLSYAPLSKENLNMYVNYLAGLNGNPPDINYDWSSVYEYRMKFNGNVAVNTAYQVPHGPLRLETIGMGDVPLIGENLEKAKMILDRGLKEGAVAFSTGLSYYPCSYSDTEELVELCKVVEANNSVYVTHIRTVFDKGYIDPVEETLEIAKRSGAKVHFSHFRTGPKNAGKVDELMESIDKAYQSGVDVSLELYPYPNGSGYAVVFLPPWAVEGGFSQTIQRLRDKSLRSAMIKGIEENVIKSDGYFTHLKYNHQYVGMSFDAVAKERNQTVPDMICDLLIEEDLEIGFKGTPPFSDGSTWDRIDKDCLELLSRPYYMVGSDSIPLGESPHPRAFGTFPKLLRLARENRFSLEKMINRMTKVPADRFGLKDRGSIEVGKAADIVVFDKDIVTDTATYKIPRSAPVGIKYVLVNGKVAVRDEKTTGIFAGRSLSRCK